MKESSDHTQAQKSLAHDASSRLGNALGEGSLRLERGKPGSAQPGLPAAA